MFSYIKDYDESCEFIEWLSANDLLKDIKNYQIDSLYEIFCKRFDPVKYLKEQYPEEYKEVASGFIKNSYAYFRQGMQSRHDIDLMVDLYRKKLEKAQAIRDPNDIQSN